MKRLILLLLCGLMAAPAWGATTPNSWVAAQTWNRGLVQFLNASTPNTYATVYTAGSNGSKITALWVDNNDAGATHVVACQIVNSTIKYGGFSLTTTSPAANTAFVVQNLIPVVTVGIPPNLSLDQNGNPVIALISGDSLQCTFQTTITSPDQIDIHVNAADF